MQPGQRRGIAAAVLVRRAAFLVVGIVLLVLGIGRLGTPAQDVERSGWLYEHYGPQGVAYGMILAAGLITVFAAVMTWRAWRSLRDYA